MKDVTAPVAIVWVGKILIGSLGLEYTRPDSINPRPLRRLDSVEPTKAEFKFLPPVL
jgi:hypothetical protein